MFNISIGFSSHKGRVRSINQDRLTIWFMDLNTYTTKLINNGDVISLKKGQFIVAAVADGMGGTDMGEFASNRVIELLDVFIHNYKQPFNEFLLDARTFFSHAHKDLLDSRDGQSNNPSFGTTLTLSIFSYYELHIFWVGDSRAYIYQKNKLELLVKEHTLAFQRYLSKEIKKEDVFFASDSHILTSCLGIENERVEPDYIKIKLKDNFNAIICSDGINSLIPDIFLKKILASNYQPKYLCSLLIEMANELGGDDNITVISVSNSKSYSKVIQDKLKASYLANIEDYRSGNFKAYLRNENTKNYKFYLLVIISFFIILVIIFYYFSQRANNNCKEIIFSDVYSEIRTYDQFLKNKNEILDNLDLLSECIANMEVENNKKSIISDDIENLKNKLIGPNMDKNIYEEVVHELNNIENSVNFFYEE